MKPLILLFILFTTSVFADGFENKYESYTEAHAAAVAANKPIFLMFTADWCGPCQSFKKNILYTNGIWPSLNKNFVVHLVDVDREKETVEMFKDVFDGKIPTLFFLDRKGKSFTDRHVGGFQSPRQFIDWFKTIHNIPNSPHYIPIPHSPG